MYILVLCYITEYIPRDCMHWIIILLYVRSTLHIEVFTNIFSNIQISISIKQCLDHLNISLQRCNYQSCDAILKGLEQLFTDLAAHMNGTLTHMCQMLL